MTKAEQEFVPSPPTGFFVLCLNCSSQVEKVIESGNDVVKFEEGATVSSTKVIGQKNIQNWTDGALRDKIRRLTWWEMSR